MSFNHVSLAAAVWIGFAAGHVAAMELGEFEFMNSCAQCHGSDAKGGGPVAEHLVGTPPDLTALTKNNDGIFPVKSMYEIIDGSANLGVHGREMPIWGYRYTARAFQAADDESADFPFDPAEDHDRYVRTRILALIEYISSLQVD